MIRSASLASRLAAREPVVPIPERLLGSSQATVPLPPWVSPKGIPKAPQKADSSAPAPA